MKPQELKPLHQSNKEWKIGVRDDIRPICTEKRFTIWRGAKKRDRTSASSARFPSAATVRAAAAAVRPSPRRRPFLRPLPPDPPFPDDPVRPRAQTPSAAQYEPGRFAGPNRIRPPGSIQPEVPDRLARPNPPLQSEPSLTAWFAPGRLAGPNNSGPPHSSSPGSSQPSLSTRSTRPTVSVGSNYSRGVQPQPMFLDH